MKECFNFLDHLKVFQSIFPYFYPLLTIKRFSIDKKRALLLNLFSVYLMKQGFMKKRVVVAGINGRMGCSIKEESLQFPDIELIGFDYNDSIPEGNVDLWIDFSTKSVLINHLNHCKKYQIPFLTGITGLTSEELSAVKEYGREIPVFLDYNMSIGINAIEHTLKKLQRMLSGYDIELIETHHNQKKDAPSGTAQKLLAVLNDQKQYQEVEGRSGIQPRTSQEIGVHAIRMGGVVGEHTVRFGNHLEEVFIGHRAYQRATFALGALKAGLWLSDQKPGFYTMSTFLKDLLDG